MRSSAGIDSPRLLAGTTVLLTLIALGIWWSFRQPGPEIPGPEPSPITSPSASPFLNTGPEAQYVGSEACHACHEAASASYHRTGMGRSMAEVGADQAPP